MKKLQIILIFLISNITFSQDFEGIIEYENSYSKINEENPINLKDLENFLGIKSTFITKEGFYKQISEGKYMSFQIYNPSESRLYYKDLIESDSLFIKDLTKFDNTEFEYEIKKNADTILNHICDKLIYKKQDQNIEEHYYFTTKYKQNPEYFKNFTFGNKNKLSELMKSVYLRYDVFFNGIIISSVATEIKEQKIEDKEFEIPKNSILKEK